MDIKKEPTDAILIEAQKYEKRQLDGRNEVNNLMSELRLNSIANSYPREVNKSIEDAFAKVTSNILIGWWVSAQEECLLVPVGGYVSQELHDRIRTTIENYIAENY